MRHRRTSLAVGLQCVAFVMLFVYFDALLSCSAGIESSESLAIDVEAANN